MLFRSSVPITMTTKTENALERELTGSYRKQIGSLSEEFVSGYIYKVALMWFVLCACMDN